MSDRALLTIPDAARALGISVATLRRWINEGAPVARRGRRGKGNATLVDPEAVRLWRRHRKGQGDGTAALRAFASRIPDLVADGVDETVCEVSGPHKQEVIRIMPACWYLVVCRILDELRSEIPDLPEISPEMVPEKVELLRKIGQ